MNKQQQEIEFGLFTERQAAIMLAKGDDYANTDRLSNFKLAGTICGISPEQQCLSLIATKVARLGQLFSGKTPKHESVADSIIDLANYSFLLHCLVSENAQVMPPNH